MGTCLPPFGTTCCRAACKCAGLTRGSPALPPQLLSLARPLLIVVLHEADSEPLCLVGDEPSVSPDLVEHLGVDGVEEAF